MVPLSELRQAAFAVLSPFRGVGRLHLSCKGPFPSLNVVNCSDLRPFLVSKKTTIELPEQELFR